MTQAQYEQERDEVMADIERVLSDPGMPKDLADYCAGVWLDCLADFDEWAALEGLTPLQLTETEQIRLQYFRLLMGAERTA